MSPPGAAMPESKGRTGAAPPGAAMALSYNAVDSASMDEMDDSSSEEDEMLGCKESLTRSAMPMQNRNAKSLGDSSSTHSDVVRLTMLQTANGSFPIQESVTNILDIELQKVKDAGAALSANASFLTIWMTLLVVSFLREKCEDEKDVWELVVAKAQKWLQKQDQALVAGNLENAKEIIKKSVPIRRVCPLGHKLSKVSKQPGSLWHCDSNSRCVGGCNSDGEHAHQTVWRCSQDKRVRRGGSCDFDICGECVKQNV
jgi:hypothetical protein